MVKKFNHKDGVIEVTRGEDTITVDPKEAEGVIKVNKNQPKESLVQEVEDKLNLIYSGSPVIIKEFIKWLEEVL